ncbi:MAG: hypothetical protein R3E89_08535 [Thiolinea sp.]
MQQHIQHGRHHQQYQPQGNALRKFALAGFQGNRGGNIAGMVQDVATEASWRHRLRK